MIGSGLCCNIPCSVCNFAHLFVFFFFFFQDCLALSHQLFVGQKDIQWGGGGGNSNWTIFLKFEVRKYPRRIAENSRKFSTFNKPRMPLT